MTLRRIAIAAVALVAAIAVAVGIVAARHKPTATVDTNRAVPAVPIVRAEYGSFTERVGAQGRVGAPAGSEAKLAFTVAGVVAALDVQVGDRVAASANLAQLDTGGLSLDLEQARVWDRNCARRSNSTSTR